MVRDGDRQPDIDSSAIVADTAVISGPYRRLQEGEWDSDGTPTTLGAGVEIGHFCLVGEGAVVGADTIVDAYVRIEGGARIGERVILTHRATVGARARIGDDAVIGGFVSERCVVGPGARIFGKLIHRQLEPQRGWDAPGSEEASPEVKPGGFVGFDAQVIGPVVVGERAYVCAGAVVTRDVPARHVAFGINEIVPHADWPGELARSPFFAGP